MYMRQLTSNEFNEFINKFPLKSPYQTVHYAIALNNEEYDSMFVGLIDNDTIVGASLILINKIHGFKYAYAPRGFLIDFNNVNLLTTFTEELKKFLAKDDIIAIKINPMIVRNVYNSKYLLSYTNPNYDTSFSLFKDLGYSHLGYNNFFEALKPRFEAIIDIDKNPLLLFKDLRKEFKTKVRSSEANGVRIYRGGEKEIELLYSQIKNKYSRGLPYFRSLYTNFDKTNQIELYYAKIDTSEHLKYVQKRYLEQETICSFLNDEILNTKTKNSNANINKKMIADKALEVEKEKLIVATNYLKNFPDGILSATCLIIKQDTTVYLFIDGFDEKFKRFNAKHLLIWKLMEKFSKLGFKKFNLGGLSGYVPNKKHKYTGLNHFKLGFNANVYEYMGDLELVTHKARYIAFRNIVPFKSIIKSKLVK